VLVELREWQGRQAPLLMVQGGVKDLGPVTALQYSPIPARRYLAPVLDTGVEDLRDALAFSVLGLATAVQQVLPGMREAGEGSVLLVNGGTSVRPRPDVAGTSVAFPTETALRQMLHTALADEGVRVRQLVVPGAIRRGDPDTDPDVLAARLWDLHAQPGDVHAFATPMPEPS